MQTNKDIFSNIYSNNEWNCGDDRAEPSSGPGSSLEYTEKLRTNLLIILLRFNVKTFLDAGCGDLTWMGPMLNKINTRYIGVDVVDMLINEHKKKFPDTEFHVKDITTDALPMADMMMCRDCLFHMSNEDIFKTLRNFLNSNIKYLFTTTHVTDHANYDIQTGTFRILNLLDQPFNFPTPLYSIDDTYGNHPQRNMAVWSREQLLTLHAF